MKKIILLSTCQDPLYIFIRIHKNPIGKPFLHPIYMFQFKAGYLVVVKLETCTFKFSYESAPNY